MLCPDHQLDTDQIPTMTMMYTIAYSVICVASRRQSHCNHLTLNPHALPGSPGATRRILPLDPDSQNRQPIRSDHLYDGSDRTLT